MTPLTSAISRALIHFVWQGSIIGISLWFVLALLKKRSANARYIASCSALAALAMLPIVTTWVLYSPTAVTVMGANAHSVARSISSNGPAPASGRLFWLLWFEAWALPVWSVGVLMFSMRLVLGYKHAFTLRRRAEPAGEAIIGVVSRLTRIMNVRRSVRVVMSALSDSPSVIGWLRPVILLPAATLMGLTTLQLEAILAHEIGHIKRYDYLVNMLQMVVETLLFYHPAVWWTSKRIRIERELCCDDLAVRFSGNALRYARALTTLEKLRMRAPSIVMASTGGPLLYRIQRLLGVASKEYGPSRFPTVVAMGLGVLCFALNVSWMRGQDAPGVKVDLGASSVIHRTSVPYPEAPRKQGITGTVQVEVTLDSTGNVIDARVLSGPDELRKTALESVLSWHFTKDAARSTRLISISFSEAGTQVEVKEPRGQTLLLNDQVRTRLEELKQEELKAKIARAEAEDARARWQVEQVKLTRRQQLEREMAEVRQFMRDRDNLSEAARLDLEKKLASLKAELDATPFQPIIGGVFGGISSPTAVGRTLKEIGVIGLSDSVRNDLLSNLPVRVGDVLSEEVWKRTDMAIHNYDEHLRVQFLVTDDGQAVLRISAPERR